jgi:hypothetical protein
MYTNTIRISLLLTEFTKTVPNEVLRVQCTGHNAATSFHKLTTYFRTRLSNQLINFRASLYIQEGAVY